MVQVSAPTLPSTVAGEQADAAVTVAVADQLKGVRTAADGWQKGLAGLLTVITSIFFLKGKESIDELEQTWQYWTAAAFVSAAVLAAASAYFFVRAAYGEPKSADVDEIRQQGLYVWNYRLAHKAARDLRSGQAALFLMLGAVTAGILIIWFAPEASGQPSYQVTRQSDGACGTLKKADNGQFKIVQDANTAVLIPKGEVSTLRIVAACP
jgi:H+/Cl- antiporter ClcA